jgi:hypothetical protein
MQAVSKKSIVFWNFPVNLNRIYGGVSPEKIGNTHVSFAACFLGAGT